MSRVIGIGTDLLKVSRIASLVSKNGLDSKVTARFAEMILHPERELPSFKEYQNANDMEKVVKLLSGRWCAKEAIFKSLSPLAQKSFNMKEWYKYNTEDGIPQINSEVYSKKHANEEFLITISHDSDLITSTVLRQVNYNNSNDDYNIKTKQ